MSTSSIRPLRFTTWMPRPLWIGLCAGALAFVVGGIWTITGVQIKQIAMRNELARSVTALNAAANSEQEREAYDGIWKHAESLAFTPRDTTGDQLLLSGPEWTRRVVTIDLEADSHRLTHRIIDSENLFLLMRCPE
jgi:hypothetical protein